MSDNATVTHDIAKNVMSTETNAGPTTDENREIESEAVTLDDANGLDPLVLEAIRSSHTGSSPKSLGEMINEAAKSSPGMGRIRRSSWWGRTALLALAAVAVSFIMAGISHGEDFLLLFCIIWAVCALLRITINIKRCHDLGWSGWVGFLLVLLVAVPYVGWLPETICMGFLDGQPFANKYGPDPKGRDGKADQSRQVKASTTQENLGDQLRELKKLLDEEILTQEEFAEQKAKVLAGGGGFSASRSPNTSGVNAAPLGTAVTMMPIPQQNYMLGAYPVTQALWGAVMGGIPSEGKGANLPVENVSWEDCQEFLRKLNVRPKVKASGISYRLPTAEEWEYACRAGATGDYCMLSDGTEITTKTLGDVAWYASNSDGEPHSVGLKKPNAFGLYDMLGNVWEWTSTGVGSMKMFKGGAFNSSFALFKNSGLNNDNKGCNSDNRGFRLAADIVK